MNRRGLGMWMAAAMVGGVSAAALSGGGEAKPATGAHSTEGSPVLDFKVKGLDGVEQDLAQYKGKVVLIVNVASQCGYTPQYEGLEKLYESKQAQGFVVLGFPANNFGQQEPGSSSEIHEFCTSKFGVKFPMFEKISVAGADQHPLYARLASQPAPIGGDPKWNFTKFLVDRSGKVVGRFEPKIKPEDAALNAQIDTLLATKP